MKKLIYSDFDYFTVDHKTIGNTCKSGKKNKQHFANTGHASDSLNQKSICGYIFLVVGGTVCFNSTKKKLLAGSTTEAEYITLSLTYQLAIWT